jgi:DNA-binding GntR family transcriptional regulator
MNANNATVSERIYSAICEDILNRNLLPGEKLTIKKLHEMYNVSSSPIREALFRLQQDGLIEYRSNAGMTVIQLRQQDVKEIYMLLTEFDAIALRCAMMPEKKDGTIVALEICIEKSREAINTPEWNYYSDNFHIIFYEQTGNSRLSDASHKIRLQSTLFSNQYEAIEENRQEIQKQHEEILAVLKEGDIAAAERMLRDHVAVAYTRALNLLAAEEE